MSTRDLTTLLTEIRDPLRLAKTFWPHVDFYDKQIEIIKSVETSVETYCKAGNMLGKDFVTAFIVLYLFLTRNPVRIITTSVDSSQLEGVLWGEIRNFIQTSIIPLDSTRGGPIIVNHLHLRKIIKGEVDGLSYVLGRVAKKGEGLLGHHIADQGDGVKRTFMIGDEASGLDDEAHTKGSTWASSMLFIGNPYECQNFFKKYCKEGDLKDPKGGYYRRVFKIKAEDSPNVRRALEEIKHGLSPSGKLVVPGVLPYDKYVYRRNTWDKIRQTVSLDAEFYEGAEVLLYPAQWLDKAERRYNELSHVKRFARAIGIDPAEGGDNTTLVAVDEYGILEIVSVKTPDTSVIVGMIIAFGKKWNCDPSNWCIDRGGGGKQLADRIRAMHQDYRFMRTVGFGESVQPNPKKAMKTVSEIIDDREERYSYVNRRAQMYGELSLLLDPSGFGTNEVWVNIADRFGISLSSLTNGFAIPEHVELRHQMSMIPKLYTDESRLRMLPKNKKSKDSPEKCLIDIIGHSPDELDALVLAVYGMIHKGTKIVLGAI